MAAKVVKLYTFCVLYFVAKPRMLIEGKHVPCLIFMGDSVFDNGNNNFLITLSKSNYLPYGIDYPDGPTGRTNNGKIIPDFLAEFLGFDKPIPPFSKANGSNILKGVNHASAGSGILDDTGRQQGDRISMNRQLFNHGIVISKIALLLGNASLAGEHLNKCVYIVNIGSNDYVNNLLSPLYLTRFLYTPQQFAAIVIQHYSKQLRTLYNYGARKVAIYGLSLIGCIPQMLSTNPTNGSKECNDSSNNIGKHFNDGLKPLIDTLNADIDGAQFIMINSANIIIGDYSTLGIKVKNTPCCTVSKIGLCEAGKEICSKRDEYFYWDNYHLTETGSRGVAGRAYDAQLPLDAYPIDIRRLVQQ